MSVFKAYDIRGIYPGELNEGIACRIGKAFVDFLKLKNKTVVVGRDHRSSSPKLFSAVTRGMLDQGSDVISIGICTNPMMNFALTHHNYDAGIMITASHNPKQYNGMKLVKKRALQLTDETGIKKIEKLVEKNKFKKSGKQGKIVEKNIVDDYKNYILSFAKIKNLKIIIDFGNGVGAIPAKPVFDALKKNNVTAGYLFEKPDENFPNHEANPLKKETLAALQKQVKNSKADIGIAFDGDADRCVFIDEQTNILPADFAFGILSEYELKEHPGETVCYDLRFSWSVREAVNKNNGKPVMMRVGNPFYKEKIIKHNALMAGELSAHVMFRENNGVDDGLFQAIKMLNILSKTGKKLSVLAKPFYKYYHSGEINSEVRDKDKKIKEIEKIYKDGKISHLDGLSVEYSDWWFNVRKSNTEPLLRLNVEAKTAELMEKKRDELLKIIRAK